MRARVRVSLLATGEGQEETGAAAAAPEELQEAALHFNSSSPRAQWPCPLDPTPQECVTALSNSTCAVERPEAPAARFQGAFPDRQPTKFKFISI